MTKNEFTVAEKSLNLSKASIKWGRSKNFPIRSHKVCFKAGNTLIEQKMIRLVSARNFGPNFNFWSYEKTTTTTSYHAWLELTKCSNIDAMFSENTHGLSFFIFVLYILQLVDKILPVRI